MGFSTNLIEIQEEIERIKKSINTKRVRENIEEVKQINKKQQIYFEEHNGSSVSLNDNNEYDLFVEKRKNNKSIKLEDEESFIDVDDDLSDYENKNNEILEFIEKTINTDEFYEESDINDSEDSIKNVHDNAQRSISKSALFIGRKVRKDTYLKWRNDFEWLGITDNAAYCKVCLCSFNPNIKPNDFRRHDKSFKHLKNLADKIRDDPNKKFLKIGSDELILKECDEKNLEYNSLIELKKEYDWIEIEDNKIFCTVCLCHLTKNKHFLFTHQNTNKHRKQLLVMSEYNNEKNDTESSFFEDIKFISKPARKKTIIGWKKQYDWMEEEENMLYCKLCLCTLGFSIDSLRKHSKSIKHKKVLSDKKINETDML